MEYSVELKLEFHSRIRDISVNNRILYVLLIIESHIWDQKDRKTKGYIEIKKIRGGGSMWKVGIYKFLGKNK